MSGTTAAVAKAAKNPRASGDLYLWQLLVLAVVLAVVTIVLAVLLLKLALSKGANVDPLLLAAIVLLSITLVVSATTLLKARSLMEINRRLDVLDERVQSLESRPTVDLEP